MPLPKKWQRFFIGRKVTHPNKSDLEGVVKYAASTRLGKKNSQGVVPGEGITTSFCVEWADGTSQVMEDKDVAAIATDEFVQEEWVLDRVLKLQECGWDEAKADAATIKKPSASNATKSKSKGPAKSKSGPGAASTAKTGGQAGPSSTNAVCISLQDLKRQANSPIAAAPNPKKSRSTLPLSSSQEANKQKQQQSQSVGGGAGGAVVKKIKTKTKAPDDNSTNDEDDDGNPITTAKPAAAAAAATAPRNITFLSSPVRAGAAGGGGGRNGRILSSMLHVSSLAFATVRNKIVYQYDEITVDGVKYRVYTKDLVLASSVCFRAAPADGKPADMTIDTWKVREKYGKTDEYFVDCIAAARLTKERKNKKGAGSSGSGKDTPAHYEYLLKYTRFELDPGPESWLSYEEVEQTTALDTWEKSGRQAYEKGMIAVKTAAGLEF